MGQETKLVKDHDRNGDGWLNAEERKAARAELANRPRRGPGGFGMRGGMNQTPPEPGAKVSPADVKNYPGKPLYSMDIVRTLFIDFESPEWEAEMADFNNTDVEIPATLRVDGKTYNTVGVHFRGASSFMMVPAGRKRSLNLSLDFIDKKQRLEGYRTLNLLNSNGDPTFLRTVLYTEISRSYIPAPKANFVRVVINGENWGIYSNAQQFNADFVKEWFKTTDGARWKVPGSPRGRGGLEYLGEDLAAYKRLYQIKSKDDPKMWTALIQLCKVLNQTPPEELEKALAPILDVDGALKFLALDKALINTDGYWTRASDYNIYRDPSGRFHIIPHDANETLRGPEGPGMRGGGGGGNPGLELDPFAGASDSDKPLLSKLLAVPALRAKYLAYMRDITEKWLDWNRLGPIAAKYHALIAPYVKEDTRKLYSTQAFYDGLASESAEPEPGGGRPPFGGAPISLKGFVEKRGAYLRKATQPPMQ